MTDIGWLHTGIGLLAIVLGGVTFRTRKGSTQHRRLGWAYVVAMLVVNVSALSMYSINGGFTAIHALAVASLTTLAAGLAAARLSRAGRPGLRRAHAICMAYSYVGLISAGASQIVVRSTDLPPVAATLGSVAVVVGIGGTVIRTRLGRKGGAPLPQGELGAR